MLICLNDLFACSGLTQTCKLLTNFSKSSFYLLPEPLRRGYFLTNYCDIQIDGKVSLEISNSYRYWGRRDMISKTYPMGLSICDENGQAIDAFNNYSYFLSSKGV